MFNNVTTKEDVSVHVSHERCISAGRDGPLSNCVGTAGLPAQPSLSVINAPITNQHVQLFPVDVLVNE